MAGVSPAGRHFGCVSPFQRRTLCHGYVQLSVHVGLPEAEKKPRICRLAPFADAGSKTHQGKARGIHSPRFGNSRNFVRRQEEKGFGQRLDFRNGPSERFRAYSRRRLETRLPGRFLGSGHKGTLRHCDDSSGGYSQFLQKWSLNCLLFVFHFPVYAPAAPVVEFFVHDAERLADVAFCAPVPRNVVEVLP